MKKSLVAVSIVAVCLIGYMAYKESAIKQQKEMSQVINDANKSLKMIEANPNRKIIQIDQNQQIDDQGESLARSTAKF